MYKTLILRSQLRDLGFFIEQCSAHQRPHNLWTNTDPCNNCQYRRSEFRARSSLFGRMARIGCASQCRREVCQRTSSLSCRSPSSPTSARCGLSWLAASREDRSVVASSIANDAFVADRGREADEYRRSEVRSNRSIAFDRIPRKRVSVRSRHSPATTSALQK